MSNRGTYGRLNTAVARVLTDARTAAGITTRELSDKMEMDRVTMERYLRDQRAISMESLYRFAVALDLTPHQVISRASALIEAEDAAAFDA